MRQWRTPVGNNKVCESPQPRRRQLHRRPPHRTSNKRTGNVPHAYFKWKDGNPVANAFRFVFLGEGDAAPLTHEVLRRAVKDPDHLPVIHVS